MIDACRNRPNEMAIEEELRDIQNKMRQDRASNPPPPHDQSVPKNAKDIPNTPWQNQGSNHPTHHSPNGQNAKSRPRIYSVPGIVGGIHVQVPVSPALNGLISGLSYSFILRVRNRGIVAFAILYASES